MKNNMLYFFCLILLLSLSLNSAWTVEDIIHRMSVCTAPPRYGTCNSKLRQWHYVSKLRRCERFIYSGCGGNNNRFYNKNECEEYCQI
ncbi:kunitz-like toxin PcKuz2 [Drosophila nasuta]|uniref:Kunitz-like toxin PcKuz2 n=1 Tax=Drosophila albomicans TaxID=7291 RepID=A0A6P8X1X0_DROAB|nr:kunitz-like toxin PcKuz2 [Drosophila albomicans]XP_060658295.1 kunitz-like toxin PcKuz2 [Drosophila nasuta]